MVQYVITSWRSQSELLQVRTALYPSSTTPLTIKARTKAVALVSVWVQRGNCPHRVESTALLISALLNDIPSNPQYAIRAAYSAAFGRFVTGLLDGHQEGKKKQSMYSIASKIGLEASFVELRHQCTHEALPSLTRLRGAAKKALDWLWENYWVGLSDERGMMRAGRGDESCRKILKEYLKWRSSGQTLDMAKRLEFRDRVKDFEESAIMDMFLDMGDSDDVSYSLQSARLAKALCTGTEVETEKGRSIQGDVGKSRGTKHDEMNGEEEEVDFDALREEMERQNAELDDDMDVEEDEISRDGSVSQEDKNAFDDEDDCGWTTWKGSWTPKPIGVV